MSWKIDLNTIANWIITMAICSKFCPSPWSLLLATKGGDKLGALASQQSAPLPDPKSMAIHPPNPRAKAAIRHPEKWRLEGRFRPIKWGGELNPPNKHGQFFQFWVLLYTMISVICCLLMVCPPVSWSALPHKNLMSEPCLNRKSNGGKQRHVVLQT